MTCGFVVSNLSSALEKYLHEELQANRLIKVQPPDDPKSPSLRVQCSPFGVIPKKSRPNKYRLIIDLSSPPGHSVNDGICKELSYVSVHVVVMGILQLGRGARQAYSCPPK